VWVLFFLVLIVAFNAVALLTGQPSGSTFASITLAALAGWLIALGCKYVETVRTPHTGWLYIPALLAIADAGLLAAAGTIQFLNPQSSLLQVVPSSAIKIMITYFIVLLGLPLIIRMTADSNHAAHRFMRNFWEIGWKGATVVVAAAVSLLLIVAIHALIALSDHGSFISWMIAVVAYLQIVRYGIEWRKFYNWSQRSLASKLLLISTIFSVLWLIDVGLWTVLYANVGIVVNSIFVFILSAFMLDCSLIFGAPLLFILVAHPHRSIEEDVSDEFGFANGAESEFADNSLNEVTDNPGNEFADDDSAGGLGDDDDEFADDDSAGGLGDDDDEFADDDPSGGLGDDDDEFADDDPSGGLAVDDDEFPGASVNGN
jgi:hypothetical protein